MRSAHLPDEFQCAGQLTHFAYFSLFTHLIGSFLFCLGVASPKKKDGWAMSGERSGGRVRPIVVVSLTSGSPVGVSLPPSRAATRRSVHGLTPHTLPGAGGKVVTITGNEGETR